MSQVADIAFEEFASSRHPFTPAIDQAVQHPHAIAARQQALAKIKLLGAQIGIMIVAFSSDDRGHGADAYGPENDTVEIGRRIAQARRQAGLTQEQLASRLGVTKRSLQGYEAGTVAPYRHLRALAGVLGRERAWFLGPESPRLPSRAARDELAEVVRAAVREELRAARGLDGLRA